MTDELEDDLRTTSDEIQADAQRLREIESEKLALSLDDPRLQELAAESTRLAERIRIGAMAEEAIVAEAVRAIGEQEPAAPGDTT